MNDTGENPHRHSDAGGSPPFPVLAIGGRVFKKMGTNVLVYSGRMCYNEEVSGADRRSPSTHFHLYLQGEHDRIIVYT